MSTAISSETSRDRTDNSIWNLLNGDQDDPVKREGDQEPDRMFFSSESKEEWEIPNRFALMNEFFAPPQRKLKQEIRRILDELWEEQEEFQEMNKDRLIKEAYAFFDNKPTKYLEELSRDELKSRLEKVAWLELGSGLLNDLSDQEKEQYRESSKRRPLFS